jgi:hypothetical protein
MAKKVPQKDIETSLEELNRALHFHTSLPHVFMHGVVKGLGTALGATVLVAFATSLALHFADITEVDTLIKAIVKQSTLD